MALATHLFLGFACLWVGSLSTALSLSFVQNALASVCDAMGWDI